MISCGLPSIDIVLSGKALYTVLLEHLFVNSLHDETESFSQSGQPFSTAGTPVFSKNAAVLLFQGLIVNWQSVFE